MKKISFGSGVVAQPSNGIIKYLRLKLSIVWDYGGTRVTWRMEKNSIGPGVHLSHSVPGGHRPTRSFCALLSLLV
jgi:hypothetical protein